MNSQFSLNDITSMVAHLFREEAGKMTATLIKLFGFSAIDLVDDVVQETFLAAIENWKDKGLPDKPGGWLMQVAKNKAINLIRKDAKLISAGDSLYLESGYVSADDVVNHVFSDEEIADSQLRLLFLCCHPSLPEKSQIIFTLQVLSGFSIDEIATALLMKVEAVKKVLLRTRQQIRQQSLFVNTCYMYLSEERVDTIHKVIYLMFNEGYKTTKRKTLIDIDLCFEAIRLCKLLLKLKHTSSGDTNALLALMFFNAARFPARVNATGEIVLLQDQDRTLWNDKLIEEAFHYFYESRTATKLSRYHIEAGISSLHCMANSFDETNWGKIVAYYDILVEHYNTPVAAIHRAVAISYVEDEYKGLEELDKIDKSTVVQNYMYYATKGELLYRVKQFADASECFQRAISLTSSSFDIDHLQRRVSDCQKYLFNSN